MNQMIEAKQKELSVIFSNDYSFSIPGYQRPYCWGLDQVSVLLDDLIKSFEDKNRIPYFLGTIVLLKQSKNPKSEVIDGQQRLTTLTILWCVLRELADENLRPDIDRHIRQLGSKLKHTEDSFRINLRKEDKLFFEKYVQEEGGISELISKDSEDFINSKKCIFDNTKYLMEEISIKINEYMDNDFIKDFMNFLLDHCYLVLVSVSDRQAAYRVFSVMNNRGLNLSSADILKADIIGKIPHEFQDSYTEKWEGIEDHIGRDRFQEFLVNMCIANQHDDTGEAFEHQFSSIFLKDRESRDFIDKILDPYYRSYTLICFANFTRKRKYDINKYINSLNLLEDDAWRPAALIFLYSNTNPDKIVRFLRNLERLAYGLIILGTTKKDRVKRYKQVCHYIRENKHDDNDSPFQISNYEKIQILLKLNQNIYGKRICNPLILKIDRLISDQSASYEHSIITIEHVLPKNPRENSIWLSDFTEKQRDIWTHRLANLILLSASKNSQANRYDFKYKKQKYFRDGNISPFALTSSILAEEYWTPEVLERRQKYLIDKLAQEWRLTPEV